MKILSSLEIRAIVNELQRFVEGKVDKVYQPDNTEVILALHRTGIGRKFVRIVPGVALYQAKRKRVSPEMPLNFCRFLRKRLNNTRIEKIEQKGFERIVEFHFQGKEEKFILICEFFSKGNVILCNEDYMIISALQVQLWKDRKIKARVKYQYPPMRPLRFDDYQDFALFIERSDRKSIVKTLAQLNLGGLYAEEVCYRAGVNKEATRVGDREMKKLFTKLNEVLEEDYAANTVKGQPVPLRMQSLGDGELYSNYSEALDEYYAEYIKDLEEEQEDAKQTTKVDKYKDILKEQEKQLIEVQAAIGENKERGDWFYANYVEIQEMIKLYKANRHDELKAKKVKIEGTNIIVEV